MIILRGPDKHVYVTQWNGKTVWKTGVHTSWSVVSTYSKNVGDIESTFKKGVEGLQATFKELQGDKAVALEELKDVNIIKALLNTQQIKTEL
jgi:hypothetical protein